MSPKKVFISYNHEDSLVADKLKSALEKKGFLVTIDNVSMSAGASIQEFIESSIRDADVTLSIVSNRSLLSAWVALESITAFYSEKLQSSKKFIACYVDDDFFKPEFRLNVTDQIDAKIGELEKLIPKYIEKKLDTSDLNSQKTRLYRLRNELGDILLRLKDSLTLDIRAPEFDRSLVRIVKAIENITSLPEPSKIASPALLRCSVLIYRPSSPNNSEAFDEFDEIQFLLESLGVPTKEFGGPRSTGYLIEYSSRAGNAAAELRELILPILKKYREPEPFESSNIGIIKRTGLFYIRPRLWLHL